MVNIVFQPNDYPTLKEAVDASFEQTQFIYDQSQLGRLVGNFTLQTMRAAIAYHGLEDGFALATENNKRLSSIENQNPLIHTAGFQADQDGNPTPEFAARLDEALLIGKKYASPTYYVGGGISMGVGVTLLESGNRYLNVKGVNKGQLISPQQQEMIRSKVCVTADEIFVALTLHQNKIYGQAFSCMSPVQLSRSLLSYAICAKVIGGNRVLIPEIHTVSPVETEWIPASARPIDLFLGNFYTSIYPNFQGPLHARIQNSRK